MATIEELKTMWKQDSTIDDDLGKAAVGCSMLHSKYLDELITAKLKLAKTEHELIELYTIKSKYFRGEMTKDELVEFGWEQWQYKSLKADIDNLINADSEYQKIGMRVTYMKTMIYFLESVLGAIKNRNFEIKAAIDWTKFRAGV